MGGEPVQQVVVHIPSDHKVVALAHPANSFDNLFLIVRYNLNPLEEL